MTQHKTITIEDVTYERTSFGWRVVSDNGPGPYKANWTALEAALDRISLLHEWNKGWAARALAAEREAELLRGRVAQPDEYRAFTPEDEGSIPSPSTCGCLDATECPDYPAPCSKQFPASPFGVGEAG